MISPEELNSDKYKLNLQESTKEIEKQRKEVEDLFGVFKAIGDEINNQKEGYKTGAKAISSLTSIAGKLQDITDGITTANSRDLKSLVQKIESERKNLINAKNLLEEKRKQGKLTEKDQIMLENITGMLEEQEGTYDIILNSTKKRLELEEKTEKSMRAVGAAAEGLSEGLRKAGLGALDTYLGIGKALDATKNVVRAKEGMVNGFETASIFAGELGANLMAALGPEVLIALALQQIVEAFKIIDSTSGDTAKSLGISYDEARGLSQEMNNIALSSGDMMVNMEGMMEAQLKLNEMLGTSVAYNGKLAEEYTSISARLKLSEEAMDSFSKLTLMNGKGLKDNLNTVSYTVLKLNSQNKLGLSYKTIQESIGKASAATRLSLGENPQKLAEAAFQAKKLGVEIEKINSISSSLLDFESSISSELEAELLTGKNLNLERARLAALNNDTATLAKEISEQMGTAADFSKMNVLQQEALAKSMGMNRDDLASMLETTEMLAGTGMNSLVDAQEKYNKMVAEGASQAELDAAFKNDALKSQLESVSMQDRFAAITKKLQGMFISIMEPLMPVLELMFDLVEGFFEPILSAVGEMNKMFEEILPEGVKLSNIFKMIGNTIGIISKGGMYLMKGAIVFIKENLEGISEILGGIKEIFNAIFYNGDFSKGLKEIGTGLVRIILSPIQAMVDVMYSVINDSINMMNKIPGVNINKIEPVNITDRIFMAKGGIVTKPTKAVIGEAGPEAVVPLDKNLNINLEPLIRKMDELISTVKQGGHVYLDSNKVGQAHQVGTVRVQ